MKAKYDAILGKVREEDSTGKADLVDGKVPREQLPIADNNYEYGITRASMNGGTKIRSSSGIYSIAIVNASHYGIDIRSTEGSDSGRYGAVTTENLDYAVRSVSPLITALPADAASPIALTDASATTRNHSFTYTHSPVSSPTYQLPAVSDTTITHEIVLYLDLTSTASFSFTDSEGATVSVDTNGVTPALGEKWTVWAEYLHGAWIVRGMKDKEAQA